MSLPLIPLGLLGESGVPLVIGAATSFSITSAATASMGAATLPTEREIGDLLVLVGTARGSNTFAVDLPDGWSELYNTSFTEGFRRCFCFYCMSASAGAGAVALTRSGNPGTNGTTQAFAVYAIRNATGILQSSSVATGSSAAPNPPNLDTGPSSTPLWLASAHMDWGGANASAGDATVAQPAGFEPPSLASYTQSGLVFSGVGISHRTAAAQSMNPGAFAIGVSSPWASATVSVR
jgi:hypothetical protein